MARKMTFQCIICNFRAVCDRDPRSLYYCRDCDFHLGVCKACVKVAAERHLIDAHNNIVEMPDNATDILGCKNT